MAVVEKGVIERLDTKAVAHDEQGFSVTVPQREGEHAAKARHAGLAPGFPCVHDDFGVGMRAEHMAERFQLGHQFLEVVDLAVEHHDHRAVLVKQRLLAGRQIDDRQAAMAEPDTGFPVQPTLVGTAMELGLVHAIEQRMRNVPALACIEDASDAAHVVVDPVPVEFSRRSAGFQRLRASVLSYTAA